MCEIVTIYKTDDKIREAAHWHKLKSNQKKIGSLVVDCTPNKICWIAFEVMKGGSCFSLRIFIDL